MTSESGKAINDYLNHYVLVADGKAAAIAAGSLVIIGLAGSEPAARAEPTLIALSILLACLATVAAGCVLYPRTASSPQGHMFWIHIRAFGDPESYWSSIRELGPEQLEREYAQQNFAVAGVLTQKNKLVRKAIWLFGLATLALAVAFGAR
jgi:hypothetical protein